MRPAIRHGPRYSLAVQPRRQPGTYRVPCARSARQVSVGAPARHRFDLGEERRQACEALVASGARSPDHAEHNVLSVAHICIEW